MVADGQLANGLAERACQWGFEVRHPIRGPKAGGQLDLIGKAKLLEGQIQLQQPQLGVSASCPGVAIDLLPMGSPDRVEIFDKAQRFRMGRRFDELPVVGGNAHLRLGLDQLKRCMQDAQVRIDATAITESTQPMAGALEAGRADDGARPRYAARARLAPLTR